MPSFSTPMNKIVVLVLGTKSRRWWLSFATSQLIEPNAKPWTYFCLFLISIKAIFLFLDLRILTASIILKQKWGRIINIGGLSAHIGAKERAHVVTSKAALVGLTKAISMEFLERGITCNCVVPGFIEDFNSKEKKLKGHWLRHPQTPNLVLKRFGNPEEVSKMFFFTYFFSRFLNSNWMCFHKLT